MKEYFKKHFDEMSKTHSTPHHIAMGFASGTLISLLPTPGFNILLGLLILFLFPKFNKMALFGAMAVWNPLTTPLVYSASFYIGNLIFGNDPFVDIKLNFLTYFWHYSRRFLVGNFILAISGTIISYLLVYNIVRFKRRSD
jgi:uncharacterized protein (DUF2062 family)